MADPARSRRRIFQRWRSTRSRGCSGRPPDLWRAELDGEAPLFPERMSIRGERETCPRRLFVQARHVFSYCEMGRLGWGGAWRDMVESNVDFLVARGRRADGFYVHQFDPVGNVLDGRADLYDQAFMLLALAHAGRALDRPDLFAVAETLADNLERSWRLPHGGYWEGEIAVCPPYRQNPHMHLLEGFIALGHATGDRRWRRDAERIADLCARSFRHRGSGALLEYFDVELNPVEGEEGSVVEPGHCFEWAWLFETLVGWEVPDAASISDGMTHFARRHGLDPVRGVAINEVRTDGTIRNAAARLWPQTERLKAALARYRRTGAAEEREEAAAAHAGLDPLSRHAGAGDMARQAPGGRPVDRRARPRQLPLPHRLRARGADRHGGGGEGGSQAGAGRRVSRGCGQCPLVFADLSATPRNIRDLRTVLAGRDKWSDRCARCGKTSLRRVNGSLFRLDQEPVRTKQTSPGVSMWSGQGLGLGGNRSRQSTSGQRRRLRSRLELVRFLEIQVYT